MKLIRTIFALAILCASAHAVIPVRQCTAITNGSSSCPITVAAHHLVTTIMLTRGTSTTLSYSDTLGNTASIPPLTTCFPSGPACPAGIAMAQDYSIGFASQTSVLFYISTGAFAGSVTFTVTGFAGDPITIYSFEYNEDVLSVDAGDQVNTTITTTGTNDLIVVMTGDSGVTTCGSITPASGFTAEFSLLVSCKSYTDRIDLPPGTYSYRPTMTGTAVPGFSAVAFGVAPVAASSVRHRSQLY